MYIVLAATAVGSTLLGGRMVDRGWRAQMLLGTSLALTALSMLLMTMASRTSLLFVGAMQGAAQGLSSTVSSVTYANYFGRAQVGAIHGLASTLFVIGSALGPMPFGLVKDSTGSFQWAFFGASAISLAAALFAVAHGGPPRTRRPVMDLQPPPLPPQSLCPSPPRTTSSKQRTPRTPRTPSSLCASTSQPYTPSATTPCSARAPTPVELAVAVGVPPHSGQVLSI